jgi:zinc dependent phospholipase C
MHLDCFTISPGFAWDNKRRSLAGSGKFLKGDIRWKRRDLPMNSEIRSKTRLLKSSAARADEARSRGRGLRGIRVAAACLVMLLCASSSFAYSVLTHEEIVDLVWADEIRPLLLQRFPGLTEEQITEAHSYAYGGAVIQDLGYYPFGSVEFSDLVHYVRSGDFVRELLSQNQDADEYAFALGALAHYASDVAGHPAVNQAVSIQYPKLRAKYGNSVRYAEDHTAHLKTEFGFDMVQVAKNRYASRQYHDFIGFQVSKPLLERTFPMVYGVELKDVLAHEDLSFGSYRFAVSRMIPQMTQIALRTHKKEIIKETPDFAKKKFLYRLSRSEYERDWGKEYAKPGFSTRVWSVLLRYMPKIGPFKALAFNTPTPKTEDMYFKSINTTVDQYRIYLKQVGAGSLQLANYDFDTGKVTAAAEYSLTDDTYAKLLGQLTNRKFDLTTTDLRGDILHFYSDLSAPIETKKDKDRWQSVLTSLDRLKLVIPAPAVAGGAAPRASSAPSESVGTISDGLPFPRQDEQVDPTPAMGRTLATPSPRMAETK